MRSKILILGGTTEARALGARFAELGLDAVMSFAGRVERPAAQSLPTRVGGFGGLDGLGHYLRTAHITHVVDATHPFAQNMSRNAVAACATAQLPLIALTRPPWTAGEGDRWTCVADIATAVRSLDRPGSRVFLAIGRMHIADFARQPQHDYLLRLVDPPGAPPPLPSHSVVIDRGPFSIQNDVALMAEHRTQIVVSKNAGGSGAFAKIAAARSLGLEVIMIERPDMPPRREAHDIEDVIRWLDHSGTDLGV